MRRMRRTNFLRAAACCLAAACSLAAAGAGSLLAAVFDAPDGPAAQVLLQLAREP